MIKLASWLMWSTLAKKTFRSPSGNLALKEAEGRKHRIIRVVEGKIGSTA